MTLEPSAVVRMLRSVVPLGCTLLVLWVSIAQGDPDDVYWSDEFNRPGTNSQVLAITEWDGKLIVGGLFTEAGGLPANHVAEWDGAVWRPLGPGLDGQVSDLIVYEGGLFAAGRFQSAGGDPVQYIARWDGATWTSAGAGTNAEVRALAIYNGDLIAVGDFTNVGGFQANRVARWDGAYWHPLGLGITNPGDVCTVSSVTVNGSNLVVGGTFSRAGDQPAQDLAQWDGRVWSPIGDRTRYGVLALASYEGKLLVSETYDTLFQWDGSEWTPFPHPGGYVHSMLVQDGNLYAGGHFFDSGAEVARFDGISWIPLGTQMSVGVDELGTYSEDLIAGGWMVAAGDVSVYYVCRWDGSAWAPLGSGAGLDRPINALETYAGEVVAGGYFDYAEGNDGRSVARWDGSRWHALGVDLRGYVYALHAESTDLYVGGNFSSDYGSPFNCIARWDGSVWHALDQGIPPDYEGEFPAVLAIAGFNDGIAVGGRFTYLEDYHFISGVLFWDGSSWASLGGHGLDGTVFALKPYEGQLIAGGLFWDDQSQARNVAAWNGSSWTSLGQGVNGQVNALVAYDGNLIAGGAFTQAGGVAAAHVARWDGLGWSPLGSGLSDDVLALEVREGLLYAGGKFTEAGGNAASCIAVWDGTEWGALGSGVSQQPRYEEGPEVSALLNHNESLFVGGSFEQAGGKPSFMLARWFPPVSSTEGSQDTSQNGFRLFFAGMNPSGGASRLRFSLPCSGQVLLTVHDPGGRLIRVLDRGYRVAGSYEATWGPEVGPGVYLVRLAACDQRRTLKIVHAWR